MNHADEDLEWAKFLKFFQRNTAGAGIEKNNIFINRGFSASNFVGNHEIN